MEKFNSFRLDLEGATAEPLASYTEGRVERVECYKRGPVVLPDRLAYGAMLAALKVENELDLLIDRYVFEARKRGLRLDYEAIARTGLETLEAMVGEGWAKGEVIDGSRLVGIHTVGTGPQIVFGWINKGVGLTTIDPQFAGKVVVAWDELAHA